MLRPSSGLLLAPLLLLGAWAASAQPAAGTGSAGSPGSAAPTTQPAPASSGELGGVVAVRERALELGREGMELYRAESWQDADDRFARAETLVHSPVFVLFMARCRRNLGHLLGARSLYRQVLGETIARDAPDPWRTAQREASEELAQLLPRIPSLRISIEGAQPGTVQLWLDGVRLEPPPTTPIALDPGMHEVTVRRGAGPEERRTVQLEEGRGALVVDFASAAGPAGSVSEQPESEPGDGAGLRIAGIVVLVAGSLGLVAWIGTGLAAVVADNELEDLCPDGFCATRYQDKVDSYYSLANAATGTMIVGGALTVAGLAMVIAAASPASEAGDAVSLSPYVGPGSVGIVGRF
jgi:hypothetical protein